MNRALRAATMGALLLTPVLLGACSAGQVNQTTSQDRDKVGVLAQVGDITVRQVQLAYPGTVKEDDPATTEDESIRYDEGDDAELLMTVVNSGEQEDTLVGISGEGFDGVFVGEPPAEPTATSAPATTETTPPATETTPPATPTTAATPTSAAPTASERISVPLPSDQPVIFGPRQDVNGELVTEDGALRIFLADLTEPLTAGQSLTVTLVFEDAGEVTVPVIVATPYDVLERAQPFNYHEGNEGEEENVEHPGGGNPESNQGAGGGGHG